MKIKIMLSVLFITCLFLTALFGNSNKSYRDSVNGDWDTQEVTLFNTSEADVMIRVGDIDNLGFGWPSGFDPFSGNSTPIHSFPWSVDTTDIDGTDRIMVVSSYDGNPPAGSDGYTTTTSRPENLPRPITMHYDLLGTQILAASLQMFVDDFQAPVWAADYEVFLNGVQTPWLENIINGLSQTGPVGKLISTQIPVDYLYLLTNDSLSIYIDDNTTGAGDGFAIDFVKLLINPVDYTYTGTIEGTVTDSVSGLPLENVQVTASDIVFDTTDTDGSYELTEVPAGLVFVEASKSAYQTKSSYVNLVAGATETADFELYPLPNAPENVTISLSADSVYITWDTVPDVSSYNIYSSSDPASSPATWMLEANTTSTAWQEAAANTKKFYLIRAVE